MLDGMKLRRKAQQGERVGWRIAARLVFVALVVGLALIAAASNSFLIAIFAAVMLGLLIRSILPSKRIQTWARGYATGEAGDRWRRRWQNTIDWLVGVIPWK
ncbi:hypothetical protein [Halorubrum sp. CSM-61]|uniref:hypothetical protein n=1 Tax=Halorubrum sp. CSM-61 TaxID=2485838 RepID=UPI000F4C8589|nr:hypothetical protein [Halorubrum sp. CSM-61]